MDKYINSIKSFINKHFNKYSTREFLLAHKNTLIAIAAIIVLGGITTAISYAYYSVIANQAIVGGQVGSIASINLHYYVEDKNPSTGAGLGTYSKSVYLPKATYTYNSTLSYCKKGSTLTYNPSTYTFTINNPKDACYVYFDVSESKNADIVLNMYVQKNGDYRLVNEIPNNNYSLDYNLSSCTNGASLYFDNHQILVNSTDKTVCNAYLTLGTTYYWNDNFTGTYSYSYPLGQKSNNYGLSWSNGVPTTYPSLELLQSNYANFSSSPIYIKTTTTGHQACLYYNNHEFCLSPNYWTGTIGVQDSAAGLATMNKLQADMETALGISANQNGCESDSYGASCRFDDYGCGVSNDGMVYCVAYPTARDCAIRSNGNAECFAAS